MPWSRSWIRYCLLISTSSVFTSQRTAPANLWEVALWCRSCQPRSSSTLKTGRRTKSAVGVMLSQTHQNPRRYINSFLLLAFPWWNIWPHLRHTVFLLGLCEKIQATVILGGGYPLSYPAYYPSNFNLTVAKEFPRVWLANFHHSFRPPVFINVIPIHFLTM